MDLIKVGEFFLDLISCEGTFMSISSGIRVSILYMSIMAINNRFYDVERV
jgi:hypothetical protein